MTPTLNSTAAKLLIAATIVLAAAVPTFVQADSALTADEARVIAKEAFLWGMHPVAIYHLRYIHAQNEKSPVYVGVGRIK